METRTDIKEFVDNNLLKLQLLLQQMTQFYIFHEISRIYWFLETQDKIWKCHLLDIAGGTLVFNYVYTDKIKYRNTFQQ